ncbi:MAG: methylmalonyl Co-A mutase-associated GTPase MeaB [Pseudomonadota bacterium]
MGAPAPDRDHDRTAYATAAAHEDRLQDLANAVRRGERRALAQALTQLENERTAGALIKALRRGADTSSSTTASLSQSKRTSAVVIGITGPPGAGKSTLVSALAQSLTTANDAPVAIIAVDPSSPTSRGAILGDRLRMGALHDHPQIFTRSLASRGALGGLSPAAVRLIDGFDAAGYGHIILETVGTGQSEIDIAGIADVKVVIAAPGMGDEIQAMKAGLLEIADILVVNKADRPGAEDTTRHLRTALALSVTRQADVPIIPTSALNGTGIVDLTAAIDAVAEVARDQPMATRREARARYLMERAASDWIARALRPPCDAAVTAIIRAQSEGALTPLEAARALLALEDRP